MAGRLVFRVGMSLEEIDREIVASCEAAVTAAERGETFEPKRTVSFENWTTFFRSVTPNRIAVLSRLWPSCGVAERVGYAVLERWLEFSHV